MICQSSSPSPISGGGGHSGGEGREEGGKEQRKIQVVSPSSTKEVAATLLCHHELRSSTRTSSQSSDQLPAKITPKPSAKVTPQKKGNAAKVTPQKKGKAPKKGGDASKTKFVDLLDDHFDFNSQQKEAAFEHFIKFGLVKLKPNAAYIALIVSLIQRGQQEATSLGTTFDAMLLKYVDEPMSTALGDSLRMMKHEKNYPKEGPDSKFFNIMRELNLHFLAGNQSALRMLTSNLQKADRPLRVFHQPTEVLDIITKPGATDQNAHIDAFLEEVQRMLCCFQLYSHFFFKAPVTPAGPVSTILFLHGGELIATPGSHPLPQLWHLNGETLPGIHQFKEYRFPFEECTFAIFSWSLCHRGSKYLDIEGRDELCNWRKFTASNSTLCTNQKYPLDATYSSMKVTDNSEDDETGKPARDFFRHVIPLITTSHPLPIWKFNS